MSLSLLIGALWATFLLGAYCWIAFSSPPPVRSKRQAFLLILLIALMARLVPNLLLPMGAGYDIDSYSIVGDLVLSGQDVYASSQAEERHPYLPFQMYWMALARWVAEATPFSFVRIVRLAPILFDVMIAMFIFSYLRRGVSLISAWRGGLLYALNPVPIFVCAYHGQFDAIPALFLILAIETLRHTSLGWGAGGWLGLGILSKSWPVLGLPSLLKRVEGWGRKIGFLVLAGLVPAIGVGFYLFLFGDNLRVILQRALGYNRGVGIWGYTYFFRLLSALKSCDAPFMWLIRNGRYLTLGVLGAVWFLRARKEAVVGSVLTTLVTFFAATHAFAIQYMMWLVPFAVLDRDHRWLTRYTVAAFLYMLLAYTTLILETHITRVLPWPQADWFIIMPAGLPAWLVAVGWTMKRLKAEGLELSNAA